MTVTAIAIAAFFILSVALSPENFRLIRTSRSCENYKYSIVFIASVALWPFMEHPFVFCISFFLIFYERWDERIPDWIRNNVEFAPDEPEPSLDEDEPADAEKPRRYKMLIVHSAEPARRLDDR